MKPWSGVIMLEARGLSYRYQANQWLFKDVHLTVQRGEIVGLKGPSGTGKTTLGKLIAGYLSPIEGMILLDGKRHIPDGFNPIQMVLQHPEKAINPQWRMSRIFTEVHSINEELLLSLGFKNEWLERSPAELSGGELQRFCLARALGKQTQFLIADEMTTMLDAVTQAGIWHTVLDLVKNKNLGVLAISHDPHLLNQISTRIIDFSSLIRK